MKFWWTVLVFSITITCYSKSTIYPITIDNHLKILVQGRAEYLVTTSEVLYLQKNVEPKKVVNKNGITDALLVRGELWLASQDGVYIYNTKTFQVIKHLLSGKKISAIACDKNNKVWIATTFDGVYKETENQIFEQQLKVPTTYAICSTADSNMWIGTNIGLYKVNINNQRTTRYAEEGHSGYELPDNIVERLFADENSNIWVLMPERISFKPGDLNEGELPSYSYIGTKDNQVKNIVSINKSAYLFATQMGVYYLPSSAIITQQGHTANEIFTHHQTTAIALQEKQLGTPLAFTNEPISAMEQIGDYFYFFTAKGGWKINKRKLLKLLLAE